ncbi:hypothetical protein MLD38_017533 [Melastoma candidum]|uniref:Uncharacterized protein n=1 Tax=Melastoma candidum TaxID=119954 RepID=A0ACB9QSU4_9MYRT|nr:hypothetical protein MLD38_017533 [Melastoma candidum]
MGLEGKLEADVEVNASVDTVFKLLAEEVHHIPNASPGYIQGVEVQEGDWATSGSVKQWSYTIDGKKEVYKEKVEVDKENKTVVMAGVGGDVLEKYKSFTIIKQAVEEGGSAKVKVQVVYEKFKETDPDPENYLNLIVNVLKETDAHISAK